MGNSKSFPAFDALHANCQLETVVNTDCQTAMTQVESTITSFKAGGPSKGLYTMKDKSFMSSHGEDYHSYIWANRSTPVKHYTDDIIFGFKGTGATCTIGSKSRSQSLSYLDYGTNYCN